MMEMRTVERNGSFGCPVQRETEGRTGRGGREDRSRQMPMAPADGAAFAYGEGGFPTGAGRGEGALGAYAEDPADAVRGVPRAHFLGREAGGLIAALSPFFEREELTPRELRLLIDLILVKAGPAEAQDAAAVTPELDLIGDSAELWLFDRRSELVFMHVWHLAPEPVQAALPLPKNETERLLTLRAYLTGCPEDPAGRALLDDIEKRIAKLTSGRVRRARRCGLC